jgi:hypothetical protein
MILSFHFVHFLSLLHADSKNDFVFAFRSFFVSLAYRVKADSKNYFVFPIRSFFVSLACRVMQKSEKAAAKIWGLRHKE